jgi:hypothetical protein
MILASGCVFHDKKKRVHASEKHTEKGMNTVHNNAGVCISTAGIRASTRGPATLCP